MSTQQRPLFRRSLSEKRKKNKVFEKDAGSNKSEEMAILIEHEEHDDTHDDEDGNYNDAAGISLEEITNPSAGRSHESHEESHTLPDKMSTACQKNEDFLSKTAEFDVSNDTVEQSLDEKRHQNFKRGTQQRSSMVDIVRKSNEIHRNEESKATPDLEFEEIYITEDEALKYDNKSVFQCFECVLLLPVSHVDQIEPGDHIVFSGLIYNHHGIIESKTGDKLTIIEATNSFSGAVLGIFEIVRGKAKIVRSEKTLDFKKEKICVVKYSRRLKPEVTIRRACSFEAGKFKYNLLRNNCEHFATYCVTGRRISVQVSKLRLAWIQFLKSGFVGISNESERNETGFKNNMICDNCHRMNEKLLRVNKIPIKSGEEIEEGDIIQFRYWNLWHDAVILSIKGMKNTNMVCNIAHYAFRGPCFHREIMKDELNIRLNGKCFKLDYSSPNYNVYPPDEVVARAWKGIDDGGQPFVFFANDSSHFARWCKLKRDVKEDDVVR